MEKKNQETIYNTRDNTNPSATFVGQQINPATHQASSSDIFDIPFNDENFDLMEMLSDRDYYFPTNTSIFDVIGAPSSVMLPLALEPPPELFVPAPALGVTSEIVNTLATPDNSSMISSSSNETATEDHVSKQIGKDGEEEKVDDKNKKLLKPKNMSTKKKKEPRFAFMTETDIDNMDDGYRWRKYGQKAVKNSPFPRNYYRCTSAGCGVKKMVERSSEDPSKVVTTYEGTHNHICPINAPRGSTGIYSKSNGFPGLSSSVGGGIGDSCGNFSSGIAGIVGVGGDVGAKLNGGNFSNGISGGGGSIGGRFSSGYDGRFSCGIGGGMAGTFSGGIGGSSGGIGSASGGIVGSFRSGSGGNFSTGIGGASGGFSSGGAGGSFRYGLGGSNFSSGIGSASGVICGNFRSGNGGGGSFSSGFGSSSKGYIRDNAYNACAIGSSSISSHAIDDGDIGSGGISTGGGGSDINAAPYTIEHLASYQEHGQQHEQQPYLYNNPSLSSYTFGAADVAFSTAVATTTSATIGSGSSFENNDFFSLELYEELAMFGERAQDMLSPQMQKQKKNDKE